MTNSSPKNYHIDVFWPAQFETNRMLDPRMLALSYHAQEQLVRRAIRLPGLTDWQVIERDNPEYGAPKLLLRADFGQSSLCLVVRGDVVITLWRNSSSDKHATLNRDNYAKG